MYFRVSDTGNAFAIPEWNTFDLVSRSTGFICKFAATPRTKLCMQTYTCRQPPQNCGLTADRNFTQLAHHRSAGSSGRKRTNTAIGNTSNRRDVSSRDTSRAVDYNIFLTSTTFAAIHTAFDRLVQLRLPAGKEWRRASSWHCVAHCLMNGQQIGLPCHVADE